MAVRRDSTQETLGLHDVTPHALRHTCYTRHILGCVDVKLVMEWMGHSDLATTMRYAQIREMLWRRCCRFLCMVLTSRFGAQRYCHQVS